MDDLVALYQEGLSLRAIGARTGLCYETVRKHLRRQGIACRKRVGKTGRRENKHAWGFDPQARWDVLLRGKSY